MKRSKALIFRYDEVSNKDVALVGGKNASLGEMYQELTKKGVNVPGGFCVTAYAYQYLIKKTGAEKEIRRLLKGVDAHDTKDLARRGVALRSLVRNLEFPADLTKEIKQAYAKMSKKYGKNISVAVRSSATAEDLPTASFAGQQDTYLNVRGERALIDACKKCFASLFTNRAISYREDKKFNHMKVFLSIGVQMMVQSESSGVIFTIDTESGYKDSVFITGSWGLGENVVQGKVNPDEFYVHKPKLRQGFKPILSRHLGLKQQTMVYGTGRNPTVNKKTPKNLREKYCVSDKEVLTLAKWGMIIEDHYSKKAHHFKPMDIEWAKDKRSNKLYIVQARPETVESQKNVNILEIHHLDSHGTVLARGKAVGSKIGAGPVNVIKSAKGIHSFKAGQVLVTDMTDPDWEPIMKKAAAIVTNRGGRTCHAAIVSRELGIPCIVGTANATSRVKSGQEVTVSCSEGEVGKVYKGKLKFSIRKINLNEIPKLKTKVMMNLGNPEQAFALCQLPTAGVGLAREEFIINSYIGIHPRALINFNKLKDKKAKKQIAKLTKGYKDKKEFFVDQLASGVGMIAGAFYPRDVIMRLSDFKSNEYAGLIGGKEFEPVEDNPMIGWRGASRYYSENYSKAFALECKAIKKVRNEFGLTNLKIMVPFCRTVDEGKAVIKQLEKNGVKRGKNGLEVYVMCEIPANVVLADEFAKVFDGFSIGSNDLTQLTLGLDRDSQLVSHLFDERNEAVLRLVEHAIKTAKQKKIKIGICGDAPSTYPDFAKFLVKCGIDSISLSPDAVMKTIVMLGKR
ncbi:MAG: phosphoenolpyruvate synthase [Candidatus Nanoarchaeia archaeon]